MNRTLALLAALAALALIVAGCGSSNDNEEESGESTTALSKSDFLKKGNAICAAGNKEIEEGFEEFGEEENLSQKQPPTEAQSKKAAETVLIPAVQKEIDEIRALGAPEGDEETVEEILDEAQAGLEKGEEDPAALVEGEGAQFERANKLAREYGLTVCGEEGEEGEGGSEES